ncbi:TPR domain protein [Synechococcus sp. JA-2-3B'a(2-13)]|uniref:tetratricopeptide repeat protein n=1 Tax=Synechococcus sp. (strain JA-2-3B'a(2-13)) TaxID=321332 RepID=UPI0000694A1B|nr:tetratricopeptide repeat protein [Synechococcus sp. JA-2-3B'a(2-13)]ABD01178.1 TPR domain protein [Synechococcus sp. JA-2-3B'a(2-13)]
MPQSKPQESPARKLLNILLLVVGTVTFLGFSFGPLFQALGPSESPEASLVTEQLRAQADGYRVVLEREPDNPIALRGLIDTQLQLNEPQGAIEPLKKLVELEPENRQLRAFLAEIQQDTGDFEGALEQLQILYEGDPKDRQVLQQLVDVQLTLGRTSEAIALLEKHLEEAPEDNDVRLRLAFVYARNNQTEKAVVLYDKLIAADPSDFTPVLGKAIALSSATDENLRAKAPELFEQAARLAPPQVREQIQQQAEIYAQVNRPQTVERQNDNPTP